MRRNPVRGLGYGSIALGSLLIVASLASEAAMAALRAAGVDPLAGSGDLAGFAAFQMEHHLAFALFQSALGAVTVFVGAGVLRRRSWALPSLRALAWFSILLNLALAPLIIYSYRQSPLFPFVLPGVVIVTVVLTAAGLVLVRFLGSSTVRGAFS